MVNSALSLRKHALGRKLRELLMLVIQAVVYKEPLSKNENETLTIQKLDLSRSYMSYPNETDALRKLVRVLPWSLTGRTPIVSLKLLMLTA